MAEKPKATSSFAQSELDKAEKQLDSFNENVKTLVENRAFEASGTAEEQQTKISQREAQKSNDIYLKPKKRIGSKEKFNDKFQAAWDYAREYVKFIAENKEIIGESLDIWTKPFPGIPAEEWDIPVNKPLWGPRYLAEQIKRKYYHRLVMRDTATSSDGMGAYYGTMAADTTIQRLDCHPVNDKKSLFMGSKTFG